MAKMDLEALCAVAGKAADAAERVIAEALAGGDWAVRVKADDTPVTDVDVAAERAIRAVLEAATPEAAFYGEETGRSEGRSRASGDENLSDAAGRADDEGAEERPAKEGVAAGRSSRDHPLDGEPALRWLVDPIDGTKSFVRGLPFYSTQIALEADGELVVGVSNAPAFGERLVAVRGGSVRLNGRDVRASGVERIDEAFLSAGNLATLARDPGAWTRYGGIVSRVRRVRGYGDFCHYHQLVAGGCDLVIESDVNILDIAALAVGVRAAGGLITDLRGRPVGDGTTSILAAATPALHAEALAALGSV